MLLVCSTVCMLDFITSVFLLCGANECLVSFSLVLFYCIFLVLEFVKVSLFSVFWFACLSLYVHT